jgi:hypothetical protein
MAFHVIGRPRWRARRPSRDRMPQNPRAVTELFIHWPGDAPASWAHVNTPAEERAALRGIQAFHMGPERRWADIAYSFMVFQSGRVYRGRGMHVVPAAQLGHNTGTVAVLCLVGPNDAPSQALLEGVQGTIHYCERRAGRKLTVRPHNAVTPTDCPGPRLQAWIPALEASA